MDVRLATTDRDRICRTILTALPEWFGLDEPREAYIAHAAAAPMFAAWAGGTAVGYVSLAEHFGRNCELHSMGVLPEWHRHGIGRLLVEASAKWARGRGHRFLTVKTLAPTHPDPHYKVTRLFYKGVGFQPFEVFDTLWGPDLPCLLLIRLLKDEGAAPT